jgi:hypothetical protein
MCEEFVVKAGGKRAERRHHRERLKKVRRFYWGQDLKDDPRRLSMLVATPALCSCWMCCNERHVTGERTMQERRQYQVDLFEDFE